MSFAYLPVWAVLTGALTLVALLYALHHFRAQPVVVKIASVQLWQEALQQALANTLWHRFRHWLAFLVSVIIVLLLWLALNGLKTSEHSKGLHLYFLDTSIAMSISDNMDIAKAQLEADISQAAAANRALWIGDAVPAALLNKDAPNALLERLLPDIHASAHVSTFADWLQTVASHAQEKPVTVHYYGAPYDKLNIPAGIRINNAYLAPAIASNAGITAIGYQHYMAENQQTARIAFTLFNSEQSELTPADITLSLDGNIVPHSQLTALNSNQFMYAGVPLTDKPQVLTVTLNAQDQFPADNTASITIPAISQLFIAVQQGLPEWLTRFISANPLLTINPAQAQVSICIKKDDTCPPADATLYFDSIDNRAAYFSPSPQSRPNLNAVWQANHWQGDNRNVNMPELEIHTADSTYARLPLALLGRLINNQIPDPLLLLSSSLQWLANPPATPPYMAVGESAPVLQNTSATVANVIGAFPLTASPADSSAGSATIATIQSPLTSALVTKQQAANGQNEAKADNGYPWSTLAALIALFLLIVEWLLIQRGRWA